MSIPFTFEWCKKKIENYISYLSMKGKKYKHIRGDIQNKLKCYFVKIPINRIIVLKNYFCKNQIIVCVKPYFTDKQIVAVKQRTVGKINKIKYFALDKNINVYNYFKNQNSEV